MDNEPTLGEIAYLGYKMGFSHDAQTIPDWHTLSDKVKNCWEKAGLAVKIKLMVDTYEPDWEKEKNDL